MEDDESREWLMKEMGEKWKKERVLRTLNQQRIKPETDEAQKTKLRIQKLMQKAFASKKEGDYMSAMDALKIAVMYQPENKILQEEFNEMLSEVSPDLAQKYYEIGMNEEEFGDFETAE